MDKRLAIFLALAMLVLVGNAFVMNKLYPPAPPKLAAKKDKDPAKPEAAKGAEKAPLAVEKDPEVKAPKGVKPEGDKPLGDRPVVEVKEVPASWVALGSLDVADPFRMLVTLTNQGAAVERIELNQYRELDDRSGYLGSLVTVKDPKGALVRIVGPGTPAAKAGLLPGDVIVSINEAPASGPLGLELALKATNPKQEVSVAILRGGNPLTLKATLTRPPLAIIKREGTDPFSMLLTLEQLDDLTLAEGQVELKGIHLRDVRWELLPAEKTDFSGGIRTAAAFRAALPEQGIEIHKRYSLKPAVVEAGQLPTLGYDLGFEIEIRNTDKTPHTVAYRLEGPNGLPTESAWNATKLSGEGIRDTVIGFNKLDGSLGSSGMIGAHTLTDGKHKPKFWGPDPIRYIGVDAQHFAALLLPQSKPDEIWYSRTEPVVIGVPNVEHKLLTNTSVRLLSNPHALQPGDAFKHQIKLFAGPKQPDVLAAYELGELIDFGWFGAVARLMTGILHFFHSFTGNYGLAIILLTVLVRSCLFPLSRKQAQAASRMQAMQPELKLLGEKYKNKKEEMHKAQMELFRKYNANPLGGCWMALVQLPIFIGLYRGLAGDIELRDAPLFGESIRWCSNLAAPDMLFYWEPVFPWLTGPFGSLGPYFNLLPVISVGLFLVQQKMLTPPPTDEQQEMQHKVMKFMMIFMGFFFFKVASGLCIYFIAGGIWAIVERKLILKTTAAAAPLVAEKKIEVKKSGGKRDLTPGETLRKLWPFNNGANGGDEKNPGRRKQKGRK